MKTDVYINSYKTEVCEADILMLTVANSNLINSNKFRQDNFVK